MKEIHVSSNLAFVAALVCYGANVEKVDKTYPTRTKFYLDTLPIESVWIFEDGEVKLVDENLDFDTILNLFVSDKLMLYPNYMNKIKDLKSLIYA